ncbi:MAG: PaaI family thioesterase [Phycisphaeraceae bacterium]|nr:PaaI family thioesterase [Phycisphaeraceae bacterium]
MTIMGMGMNNMPDLRLEHHPDCVVCSPTCGHGLRMKYELDDEDRAVGVFACPERFGGYPGLLHGGVIAALLDGAMTHWLFLHGHAAVTAELAVRFRHPVRLGETAVIRAWQVEARSPIFRLGAELVQDEICKARAHATFKLRQLNTVQEQR